MEKVSVIIAAWNAAATLEACIESLQAQQGFTSDQLEILVVDDCSTDSTWSLLQQWRTRWPNLFPLQTTVNSGPSAARNLGLAHASGDWIAIVDGDDRIQPLRLQKMLELASAQELDICFDNLAMRRAETPQQIEGYLVPPSLVPKLVTPWSLAGYALLNMPYESAALLGFLKPVMRREFLSRHALAYRDELRNSEDFILIVECLIAGARIGYLDEALYDYFIYSSSLSGKFNQDAHRRLMAVEQTILATANQLSSGDRSALQQHLLSLQLAEESNQLFKLVREKNAAQLLSAFWRYRANGLIHVRRLSASLMRKLMSQQARGR